MEQTMSTIELIVTYTNEYNQKTHFDLNSFVGFLRVGQIMNIHQVIKRHCGEQTDYPKGNNDFDSSWKACQSLYM